MKLVIVLLITCLMQVSAATFAQKLTYSKKGATLEQIFKEIRKQTGYNVVYSSKQLDDSKRLDVDFKNTGLTAVLDQLKENQGLVYSGDSGNTVQSFSDQSVQLILPDSCPSFLSWYSPCPGRSVSIN